MVSPEDPSKSEGTDLPRDCRLRQLEIGIFGGKTSSQEFSSPLYGPLQRNDKAELVVDVLRTEAVEARCLSARCDLFVKLARLVPRSD